MADWPVFVLTLPGDEARRAPLMTQLAAMELVAEPVLGVDGRQGLPPEYEPEIDRAAARARMGRSMTDGEFACALSHRAIYRRIVEDGLPGAIVLEDDTILSPGFSALAKEPSLLHLRLLLIDYAYGRAIPFSGRRLGVMRRYRLAYSCTMANAYFVNAEGALLLLRATSPVSACADWPCCLFGLKAWALAPRLATHQPPEPGRVSHLDAQRNELTAGAPPVRDGFGLSGLGASIRRRVSVRIGRPKGQR